MSTNKQFVQVSKVGCICSVCGPRADPGYHHLSARPQASLPTSCSRLTSRHGPDRHRSSQTI